MHGAGGGGDYTTLQIIKITLYLHEIDNFLQIWIFGSKYWPKCDL